MSKVVEMEGVILKTHMAIRQQHLGILQFLLKHEKVRALLSIENNEGKTALQLAQSLEESAFYQAFVDAKLIGQKHVTDDQTAVSLPMLRIEAQKRSAADQPNVRLRHASC